MPKQQTFTLKVKVTLGYKMSKLFDGWYICDMSSKTSIYLRGQGHTEFKSQYDGVFVMVMEYCVTFVFSL